MKVLAISLETWCEDNNAGNVIWNLFGDAGFELANIYCELWKPFSGLCKGYYQIAEKMMIVI